MDAPKTSAAKQPEDWLLTCTESAPTEEDFDEIIWRLLPDADPTARSTLVERLGVPLGRRKKYPCNTMFVHHQNLELCHSSYIFVHPDDTFAKSFEIDDDGNVIHTTRSCEGNRNKTGITVEAAVDAGLLLQHLLKAWNGTAFQAGHPWPYGIRVLKKIDTESQWKRMQETNRLRDDSIHLGYEYGAEETTELYLVVDDRLRSQGCFQLTAHPPLDVQRTLGKPVNALKLRFRSFTFLVAVDFTHQDFLRTFNHRRQTFPDIASPAIYCFLQALAYVSEQKHLVKVAAQQRFHADFLRITQPVSDEVPAIGRQEKAARQQQQKREKKRKKTQATLTIPSLIANNQISLPSAEPHDDVLAPEKSKIHPTRIEREQHLLGMQAGPSATSSADTFTTAMEDVSDVGSDVSTFIEHSAPAASYSEDASAQPRDLGPKTHAVSIFKVPPKHRPWPSSSSETDTIADTLTCASSSPTPVDNDELSQTEDQLRYPRKNLAHGSKAVRKQARSSASSGSCDIHGLAVASVTRDATEPTWDVKRTDDAAGQQDESAMADQRTHIHADAIRADQEKCAVQQANIQTGRAADDTLSPTHEEQSVLALAICPSDTIVYDDSSQQLGTAMSRLSLSSDASTVVPEERPNVLILRNGTKTRARQPSRIACHIMSSVPTSPTMMRNQLPSQLLHRGSQNLRLSEAAALPRVDLPNAASERCTSGRLRGLLNFDPFTTDLVFSYAERNVMTNCWHPDCQQPTTSRNGRTALCPRCGPYSYVRYCSIQHLHADVRRHYIEDCTRRANHSPYLDESTILPLNSPSRRFVTCLRSINDSYERHRQALYRSYPPDVRSDYYVFTDADKLIVNEGREACITSAMLAKYRGFGCVIATVRIPAKDARKAQFASLLERLLSLGCAAGTAEETACGILFLFIKCDLQDQGVWDEIMIDRMCLAMQLEFGWRVPPKYFS